MKYTKVVSKCCKAGVIKFDGLEDYCECSKCRKQCNTETITLTPDSEIREVLNKFIDKNQGNGKIKKTIRTLTVWQIAEQLKIDPKLINK